MNDVVNDLGHRYKNPFHQRSECQSLRARFFGAYGSETFPDIAVRCHAKAGALGVELDFRQSRDEGEIIGWIHSARGKVNGIIINAAGLSYTSISVMDALLTFDGDVTEVHLSNIDRREPFRNKTYSAKAALGSICGWGRSAMSWRSRRWHSDDPSCLLQ